MNKNYTTYTSLDFAQDSWFIKWIRGDAKAARFWEKWQTEHPDKNEALEEARQLVEAIRVKEEEPSAQQIKNLWNKIDAAIDELAEEKREARRITLKPWYGLAAAATVALLLTFFFYNPNQSITAPYGEHLAHYLPDGSKVELNSGSSIYFSPKDWNNNRSLKLEGEAFFEVKKGSNFSVQTDKGKVEVLGTSFNVNTWGDAFIVDCFTGKVRVSIMKGNSVQELTKGMGTSLQNSGKLASPYTFNPTQKTDWRKGEFNFKDQTLATIVATLERQFDINIEVEDSQILHKTGSFQFSTRNRDSVLNNLKYVFDLNGEEKEGVILLSY